MSTYDRPTFTVSDPSQRQNRDFLSFDDAANYARQIVESGAPFAYIDEHWPTDLESVRIWTVFQDLEPQLTYLD